MTHERSDHPHFSEHERSEVESLANTVLAAFELVDTLEVSKFRPEIQKLERTISGNLLPEGYAQNLLPPEIAHALGDEAEITISYDFVSLGERPSLEIRIDRVEGDDAYPFATLSRPGSAPGGTEFHGDTTYPSSPEGTEFIMPADDVAEFMESLAKLEGLIINEHGVAVMELLQELVHDPQYPPIARFLADVLAERGAGTNDTSNYRLKINSSDFILHTNTVDGKTHEVTVIEVLAHDIEVLDSDIVNTYDAVGANISRTKLKHAISFFTLDQSGSEVPLDEDVGELDELRNRFDLISKHLNEAQL